MTKTRKQLCWVTAAFFLNSLWAVDFFCLHFMYNRVKPYGELQDMIFTPLVQWTGGPEIMVAVCFAWLCFCVGPLWVAGMVLSEEDTEEQKWLATVRRCHQLKVIPLTLV